MQLLLNLFVSKMCNTYYIQWTQKWSTFRKHEIFLKIYYVMHLQSSFFFFVINISENFVAVVKRFSNFRYKIIFRHYLKKKHFLTSNVECWQTNRHNNIYKVKRWRFTFHSAILWYLLSAIHKISHQILHTLN